MLLFCFDLKLAKRGKFSPIRKNQLKFFRGIARKISHFFGGINKLIQIIKSLTAAPRFIAEASCNHRRFNGWISTACNERILSATGALYDGSKVREDLELLEGFRYFFCTKRTADEAILF